ncbi:MAG: type II toxin-antitoxin system VapC family toxin [Methanophagales archaeon ANME-1-THS]|nr:MAG: type II toxin-antitoxin system VapC family toxin [Methanophagales archaeon ANME-1-THS]
MAAIKQISESRKLKEVRTMKSDLFIRQAEIEEKAGLSYFDSLIAASALAVDGALFSDDSAFDRVQGLKRIPLG